MDDKILSVYSKSRIDYLNSVKEIIVTKHENQAHLAALKAVVEFVKNNSSQI